MAKSYSLSSGKPWTIRQVCLSMQDTDFDDSEEVDYEIVIGDEGPLLVVRRVCFTSRKAQGEDWRRNNIHHSTCIMGGKVCKLVIGLGSCKNVVLEEAIQKLNLETENHPTPYRLEWLQKGNEVTIIKCSLVFFNWS
jgi:hypothetical protein